MSPSRSEYKWVLEWRTRTGKHSLVGQEMLADFSNASALQLFDCRDIEALLGVASPLTENQVLQLQAHVSHHLNPLTHCYSIYPAWPELHWVLTWFNQEGDDFLVGEELLVPFCNEDAMRLFRVSDLEELIAGGMPITKSELALVQARVSHRLDLQRYCYFLEAEHDAT